MLLGLGGKAVAGAGRGCGTVGSGQGKHKAAICPLGKATFLCVLLMGGVCNVPDEMREARVGQL